VKPVIKFRMSCGSVAARDISAFNSVKRHPWLLRLSPELGSCGKVEVDVLGSPYLMFE